LSTTILIGQVSCSAENVAADDLRAGVIFGLMAIRRDGSEVPVEGVPTLLDLDDLPREKPPPPRDPNELVMTHCHPPLLTGEEHASSPRPREPGPSGVIAIALVGAAVAFGARRGFVGAGESHVKIPRARVID